MAVAAETWTGSEKGVDVVLARAASGDDDAVAYLYRRYVPALVHYAQRRGATDAEGVADLAFLDTINALPSMRSWTEPVFRAYSYQATRSRISGDYRRNTVDTVMLDDELDLAAPGSVEETVVAQRGFDDLLDGLSPGQRDVIVHRFLGGFSVAETAARLGRSPGAVKQLQFQGLTRLRASLLVAMVLLLIAGGVALSQTTESVVTDMPTGVDDGSDGDGTDVQENGLDITDPDRADRRPFAVELFSDEEGPQVAVTTTILASEEPITTTADVSSSSTSSVVEAATDEPAAARVADAASGQLQVDNGSSNDEVSLNVRSGTRPPNEDDEQQTTPTTVEEATTTVAPSTTTKASTTTTAAETVATVGQRRFPSLMLLRNERLERCAAVASDGVDVVNRNCQHDMAQKFEIIERQGGAFWIVSAANGKCMERGHSDDRHSTINVYLAPCNDGDRQEWRVDLGPDGAWNIKSMTTGFCMDPDGPDSAETDNVGVRICDGTSSQNWRFVEV